LEEAIAAYRKNQELNPTWFMAPANKLALAYLHEGDYSLAEASAHRAYANGKPALRAAAASVLGEGEVAQPLLAYPSGEPSFRG
jgi:Flp pilus assembly protein TadD